MLYFGGSTFGYNALPDYADAASPHYNSEIEVLLYYSDFYGFNTYNCAPTEPPQLRRPTPQCRWCECTVRAAAVPAAWRYRNLLLTSIHSEVHTKIRL
eukprot:SAG11_NODE_279_length_11283_cov_11.461820_11_plen_98_part_00